MVLCMTRHRARREGRMGRGRWKQSWREEAGRRRDDRWKSNEAKHTRQTNANSNGENDSNTSEHKRDWDRGGRGRGYTEAVVGGSTWCIVRGDGAGHPVCIQTSSRLRANREAGHRRVQRRARVAATRAGPRSADRAGLCQPPSVSYTMFLDGLTCRSVSAPWANSTPCASSTPCRSSPA